MDRRKKAWDQKHIYSHLWTDRHGFHKYRDRKNIFQTIKIYSYERINASKGNIRFPNEQS